MIALSFLLIVGLDVFAIWAFWNHYDIDAGAYVAAVMLVVVTPFIGAVLFFALYKLRQPGPAFTINSQGFVLLFFPMLWLIATIQNKCYPLGRD